MDPNHVSNGNMDPGDTKPGDTMDKWMIQVTQNPISPENWIPVSSKIPSL
jgi:hypothetical protein